MLAVDDLHTYYGDSHVLRGVALALPAGVSLGLLGRNGMGKTTLIRTLMGHVRPASGRVQWEGRDITAQPPERVARLGIAYVPEGRMIFPNLSVRENLVMAARPASDGVAHWTLDRVLATFPRLAERLRHGGQQLSGGEQQMLAIGRALMTNPMLLVLDEATEGLAPVIRDEIWRTLAELKREGLAQIVIDKNVARLLALADRHYVLEKGRVVWEGDSQRLRAQPQIVQQYMGVGEG